MRTYLKFVLAACVLLLTAALSPTIAGASTTAWRSTAPSCGTLIRKASGGYWTCTFDDEFSGSTVNTTKWTVGNSYMTGHTDGGLTCYTGSPNNVAVANGSLNLTIRKAASAFACPNPYGTTTISTSYSSAELMTAGHFSQTYGRFEVRAKLPSVAIAGLNETFWLWPNNQTYGPFPASGEIDFTQGYSAAPTWNVPALHYNPATSPSWPTNTNTLIQWPPPYNQAGSNCTINQDVFNTFTAVWVPGQISIFVNGNSCLVDNYSAANLAVPAPFNMPFFMVLTQALDGNPSASLPFPQTTSIDYVRIWK